MYYVHKSLLISIFCTNLTTHHIRNKLLQISLHLGPCRRSKARHTHTRHNVKSFLYWTVRRHTLFTHGFESTSAQDWSFVSDRLYNMCLKFMVCRIWERAKILSWARAFSLEYSLHWCIHYQESVSLNVPATGKNKRALKFGFSFARVALSKVLISATIHKQIQFRHGTEPAAISVQDQFFKMDTTCHNEAVRMNVLPSAWRKIPI